MTKRRALIVEDDHVSAEVLNGILKLEGYENEIATNGAEGLHKYFTSKFDVVLLDLMMPEVSGEDFIKVIESLTQRGIINRKSHIIIVSAVSQYAHLKRLVDYVCVQAALPKPVLRDALVEQLRIVESELL